MPFHHVMFASSVCGPYIESVQFVCQHFGIFALP